MAIGACDDCKKYYLFEEEVVEQRRCPHCGKPLRLATLDEALEAYQVDQHPDEGDNKQSSEPSEEQAGVIGT